MENNTDANSFEHNALKRAIEDLHLSHLSFVSLKKKVHDALHKDYWDEKDSYYKNNDFAGLVNLIKEILS